MKKLFFLSIILSSLNTFSQGVHYGNWVNHLNGNRHIFLNHGDSIGYFMNDRVKVHKPLLFATYTTSARPSAALFSGAIIYNSDSAKHQFSDGANWNNIASGATGGSDGNGIYSGSGSLSGNTTVTGGSSTLSFSFNSQTALHLLSNGNVAVGGTSDGGGYKFHVNGIGGFTSGANSFLFNGTNVAYTSSNINTVRFIDDAFRWDWEQDNGTIRFTPVTSNSAFFSVRNTSGTNLLSIDVSGATTTLSTKVKINGLISAASPTYILMKQSDSSVSEATVLPVANGGVPAGGTTGQILTKNSNTNYDYGWANAPTYTPTEGSFTPTLTTVSNVTGTPTATGFEYQYIGNWLYITGKITFDPTNTGTLTEIGISLPSGYAFTSANETDCIGSGNSDALNETHIIKGDVTNDRATLRCTVVDVASREVYVSYRIKVTLP